MDEQAVRAAAVADALRRGQWVAEAEWIIAAAVAQLGATANASPDARGDETIRAAARVLNANRRYRLTGELIAAWRANGGRSDAVLDAHYAQALIDCGGLDEAEAHLAVAIGRARRTARDDADRGAVVELLGLSARVAKDRFVRAAGPCAPGDSGVRALLDEAVRRYDDALRDAPRNPWLRINAIALRLRRARDAATLPPADMADEARALIAMLQPQLAGTDDDDTPWHIATLSEACLALGDACDAAQHWLQRLLEHPRTTAFQLAAYARQLREIWQGDALRPDDGCAARLSSRLLEHGHATTGTVAFDAAQINDLREIDTAYERNFCNDTGLDLARIAQICESIGCVCTTTGRRVGTGFLVDRRSLWPDAPAELVFVTNAHVISETVAGALHPHDAWIAFTSEAIAGRRPGKHYGVAEVLFSSRPGDIGIVLGRYERLDITIVRLDEQPPRARGLRVQRRLAAQATSAFVIGHPNGRDLQISTKNSTIIDVDWLPRLFHYRTATEPGSSGSPVFDDDWNVIGVHHGGRDDAPKLSTHGVHAANEGVTLDALCKRLANTPPPRRAQ